MPKHVIVIGSGLAGMSAAAYLSKQNHQVTVVEKNSTYGGRLQQFSSNGFTFDMGPVGTGCLIYLIHFLLILIIKQKNFILLKDWTLGIVFIIVTIRIWMYPKIWMH